MAVKAKHEEASSPKAQPSQTGEDHFAERARVAEETSDDSRFSTTEVVVPAQNGNGALSVERRGKPTKE